MNHLRLEKHWRVIVLLFLIEKCTFIKKKLKKDWRTVLWGYKLGSYCCSETLMYTVNVYVQSILEASVCFAQKPRTAPDTNKASSFKNWEAKHETIILVLGYLFISLGWW